MSEISYDLIVLGGGPAGYAAGIRAGQLGKKAVVVEMERAGGTCLNWGCIPSKALLKSAETFQSLKHTEDLGISCGDISYDFEKIIQRSRGVADQMGGGIEFLFKKNKVDYIVGKGMVRSAGEVEITEGDKAGKVIFGSKIMIATGCKPRTLDEIAVDGARVMTSREALAMKKQPESIAISAFVDASPLVDLPAERCRSGRTGLTRNQVYSLLYPGFESLSLRHK